MTNRKELYNEYVDDKVNDLKELVNRQIQLEFFYSSDKKCVPSSDRLRYMIKDTLTAESILNQGIMRKGKRAYLWNEMILAQDFLELLSILESIKYAPNKVNARQLLHGYLYSKYDYQQGNILRFTKRLDIIESFSLTYPNVFISKEIPSLKKRIESPTKSIRDYLNNFLKFYAEKSSKIYLSTISDNDDIKNEKKRYYISAYDMQELLLYFTYIDGRNFEHCGLQKDKNKTPTRKKNLICSEYSYQKCLEMISSMTEGFDASKNSIEKVCLATAIFYQSDRVFLFQKLQKLSDYHSLYQENIILSEIIHKYRLTYHQVMELKQFMINSIFYDEEFIVAGLKSCYLDFMIPFDIIFQSHLFSKEVSKKEGDYEGFKQDLETIKQGVKELFKFQMHSGAFYEIMSPNLNLDREISISYLEDVVLKNLETNPFFINYYSRNLRSKRTNALVYDYFMDFDIIKKALPEGL